MAQHSRVWTRFAEDDPGDPVLEDLREWVDDVNVRAVIRLRDGRVLRANDRRIGVRIESGEVIGVLSELRRDSVDGEEVSQDEFDAAWNLATDA